MKHFLKDLIENHPAILAVVLIVLVLVVIWWIYQPVEVIVDPSTPYCDWRHDC